jgi:hypothetical protein
MGTRGTCAILMLSANLMSALGASSYGQDAAIGKQAQPPTGHVSELGPEKRKIALSMLKTGEAEARTLPPDLRSYALAQVARGYARMESPRTTQVLADAFASSYVVSDYLSKPRLQRDILFQLLPLDQSKVMELLPQAEAGPRADVTRELVRKDIQTKKLDKAEELMEQMCSWTEYPYKEGSELMDAFPREESSRSCVLSGFSMLYRTRLC